MKIFSVYETLYKYSHIQANYKDISYVKFSITRAFNEKKSKNK